MSKGDRYQWTTIDVFCESPINQAHLLDRKAEKLVALGNWEESLKCYDQAKDHILNGIKNTSTIKVLQTLKLQLDNYTNKKRAIEIKKHESLSQQTTCVQDSVEVMEEISCEELDTVPPLPIIKTGNGEVFKNNPRESDSLLQFLNSSNGQPLGQKKYPKAPLDIVEELQITNQSLSCLVEKLMLENESLRNANNTLKQRNSDLEEELLFTKRDQCQCLKTSQECLNAPTTQAFVPGSAIPMHSSICNDEIYFDFDEHETVSLQLTNAMEDDNHNCTFTSGPMP